MNRLKVWLEEVDAVAVARYLLLAELVFLFASTSLAVVVETLLFLLFLAFPVLRRRVFAIAGQPMVLMALVWIGVVTIGLLYSIGPGAENIAIWKSWRKIFLLPLAAAVFDEELWKRKLIWTFLGMIVLGLLVSCGSWLSGVTLLKREAVPGIVIHNHATQGILFAAGFFTAALALRFIPPRSSLGRWLLGASMLGLCVNIIFITPGRSGYLVFLVLSTLLPFFLLKGWPRYLFTFVVPLVVGFFLFYSPIAGQRIMQGVDELQSYKQDKELTSMGIRMMMWKNTVAIIKERPFFGYGTGGFIEGYRRRVEGKEGWQQQVVADPHNQYLRIAAEQGLAGLMVFFVLLGAFFRQKSSLLWRYMGLGVLLAWCASSLFSAHFSTFVEGRFIWLWCGALLSTTAGREESAGSLA